MKAASRSGEKKAKDDSYNEGERERYSFSGISGIPNFATFSSLSKEKLKSFLNKKRSLITDILVPNDIKFPGLSIRHYQLPKFYESNNPRSSIYQPSPLRAMARCTSDGLFCSSEDSPRAQRPVILSKSNLNEIFPSDFFLQSSRGHTTHSTIVVISKVDLDGRNLNQYLEYLWSDQSNDFWTHINYLYRIDLSKLLSDPSIISEAHLATETILARLILQNLDHSFTETTIKSSFTDPSTTFLVDGFNEVLPYIDTERYSYIEDLITFVTERFNVQVNTGKHTSGSFIDRFSPTKVIHNDGYNNKRKIFSYLYENFRSEPYYESLVDFIKFNKPIQKMCESPSFLMSVAYIIANNEKLGHSLSTQEATLSSIYYDLYLLANNNFNSRFQDNVSKQSTKNNFIALIKEFALIQIISKDLIDITQILPKYSLNEADLHFMMTHFPSLKGDTTTKITSNYVFIDNQYRDFIAAFHLKELLQSGDKVKITYATTIISENIEQEQFIKFIAGIIALERSIADKTKLIDLVLKAIEARTDKILRIDLDNLIALFMKIIDKFKDQAESIVPIRDKMSVINKIIIEEPLKWHSIVIEANYHVRDIEERYRAKLFSDTPEDQLFAIDYYSKVKISDSVTRALISDRLITLSIKSGNLTVRESSISALEVYDDIETVNTFFQEVISNPQEISSIIISVLETMAEDGNPSNIPILLSVLSNPNPYVIFKTIEALEKSHRNGIDDSLYLNSLFNLLIKYEPLLPEEIYTLINKIYIKRNFDTNSLLSNLVRGIQVESAGGESLDRLNKLRKLISYKIFETKKPINLWDINEIARQILIKLKGSQPGSFGSLLSTRSENQKNFEIITIKFLLDYFILLKDFKIKKSIKENVFKILREGDENSRLAAFTGIKAIYNEYPSEVIDLFIEKLGNTHLPSLKNAIIKFILIEFNSSLSSPESLAFHALFISHEQLNSILKIIKKTLLSAESPELRDNCLEFIYYLYLGKSITPDFSDYIQIIKTKQFVQNSKNFLKLISLNPSALTYVEIRAILNSALESPDPELTRAAFNSISHLMLNQGISIQDKNNCFELMLQNLSISTSSEMLIFGLNAIAYFMKNLQLSNHIKLIDFSISVIDNPSINNKVKLKLLEDILINSINDASITATSIQLEDSLTALILQSPDSKQISAASNALIRTYKATHSLNLESKINSKFIEPFHNQQTDDYTKAKIIKFLGIALYSLLNKKPIIELMLFNLDGREILIDESLQAIRINLYYFDKDQLICLINKIKILIATKSKTSSAVTYSHIMELIADINYLQQEKNLLLAEFIESKSSFDHILCKVIASQNTEPNNQLIDSLVGKVFINRLAIAKSEIYNLNSLTEYIAYRIVHTKSNFNARTLIKLLQFIDERNSNKLNYVIINELKNLSPREQSDKATLLLKMLEELEELTNLSFSKEYGLIESLKIILSSKEILVEEYFPSLKSILDDLPQFIQFISQHRLPVIFTQQELKVGNMKYMISAGIDPETQISVSREIYLALTATVHAHELIKPVLTDSMFLDYTLQQLDLEGSSQFSILQRKNRNGDHKQTYFLIEQATIFGNTQIACFTWINKELKITYHFSNDPNFRTNILGLANEYDYYEVLTYSIKDLSALSSVKKELLNPQDLNNLIQKIFLIMGEPKRLSINHNELIGFDGYNERLVRVEREQADIRYKLEEIGRELAGFELKQKSLEHLLSIKQNYNKYSEDIFEGLSPYQTGVVKTIIFQLETLFDAARVVQTEMVANSKKGICGNIGALFSSIAPSIPFAGPAVWFFGSILSAYDTNTQEKIARNIANLAIRSKDAKQIIEVVALFFVKHKFSLPEESSSDGIMEYINTAIDGANSVLSDGIMTTIVTKISEKIVEIMVKDHTEREISDEQKGEEDGAIIVNLLIPLISSGKCEFLTDKNKQIGVIKSFLETTVHLEIVYSPVALLIHPVDDGSSPTELKAPDLLIQNIPEQHRADTLEPAAIINLQLTNTESSQPLPKIESSSASFEFAIVGGSLMKIVEVWDSIKYLGTHYVPVIPKMYDYGIYSTFLIDNEHSITTFLYGVGAVTFTTALQINPIYAAVGTIIYSIKPYIYYYENELFKVIDHNDGIIKYAKPPIYFLTELAIITTTSLPFININAFYTASFAQKFYTALPIFSQTALTTSTKIFYLENPNHQTSNMTYYLAEGTTTAAIISSSLVKYSQYSLVKDSLPHTLKEAYIIINAANVITFAHTTHQLTTYFGDVIDHATENNV